MPASAGQHDAELTTTASPFGDVVLAGRLFVPLNQRPWEWRAKQLDDLFDDLVDTTDRRCHQGADGRWVVRQDEARVLPHFFGPLVLETDPVTGERAVVDGQQRCTATTVLVAAMRDAVEPFCGGPTATRPTARSLRQALNTWLMADSEGGGERSRLHLDPTIAEFFDRYIIQCIGDEERAAYLAELSGDPVTDAEDVRQALIEAAQHLTQRLGEQISDRHPDGEPSKVLSRIRVLHDTLRTSFIAVVIHVHRTGMSPQLFAGLNARGTPLNEADKIKNELFLLGDMGEHDEIKSAWDDMVRAAPERDAETFLRLRHIATVDDTRQADLYHSVRRRELQTTILPVVRRWAEDARLMRITAGQEAHPNVSEVTRRHLLDVRLQRHTYVRPLLLAAARAYLANDEDSFAEAALLARNVGFRELAVRRTQPETFLRRLGPIARALNDGCNLQELRRQLLEISPDDEFIERFAIHHEQRTAVQYYILYELELAAGGRSGLIPAPHSPDLQDHANNIEHVLPRTPSRTRLGEYVAWRDPDDPLGRRKNLRLHRQYFQRIGNLLLIESEINAELSDYDFRAKQDGGYPLAHRTIDGRARRTYADSTLRLPCQLADTTAWPTWGPDDVDRRQRDLAQLALRAWRLAAPRSRRRAPTAATPARRRSQTNPGQRRGG